ncbi:hypothetical protein HYFRA_00010156 [Hymenoscyphus fraxineus]|uniref:RlpA-like protein double-psi beta-barrel domain-containing protein n=1 Tax=Hymenoscyphus fraxineus TaxID=746836 RepID=A0A9N9PTE1_9HELO|nr:hypothetical protein HYFRA_00010156 [Hymenoscyphus fraxineus]
MHFHLPSLLALIATTALASPSPIPKEPATGTLEKRITHTGLATVYTQEGGTGSCGQRNPDSSFIAAISTSWQGTGYPPAFCGRKVQVTNVGSNDGVGGQGNTIIATIEDTCPGCDANHIDFSVGSWNQLTNNAAFGTANIEW